MIGLLMMLAANDVPSFIGADELRALCVRDRVACSYYVAGASDALAFMQSMGISKPVACPKLDASLEQLTIVVQDYLRAHASASGSGFGIVATALSETYPCK